MLARGGLAHISSASQTLAFAWTSRPFSSFAESVTTSEPRASGENRSVAFPSAFVVPETSPTDLVAVHLPSFHSRTSALPVTATSARGLFSESSARTWSPISSPGR